MHKMNCSSYENIIRNSNYDFKCKKGLLKQKSSDLYVNGIYNFHLSYSKKKINRKRNNIHLPNGKLTYKYTKDDNILYVNNKLKIINAVTNRFICFYYIEIESTDGRKQQIVNKTGIKIREIIDAFCNVANGHMPVNVYTKDPIIFELFFFIVNNYIYQDTHFTHFYNASFNKNINKYQIYIQFIFKCSNVFQIHKHKVSYKTHSCIMGKNTNRILDDNNNSGGVDNKWPYKFSDQSVIIVDNNINTVISPKIHINIPRAAIHQDYFNDEKNCRNNYWKRMDCFVKPNHVFLKHLGQTFNYFTRDGCTML